MILYDLSYFLNSISGTTNPNDYQNEKEHSIAVLSRVLDSLTYYSNYYGLEYGDLVIAVDDQTKRYWRKNYYPLYKSQRDGYHSIQKTSKPVTKAIRQEWKEMERLLSSSKWRVVEVDGCEADDVIATITKSYEGDHLIVSPDKDFIQLIDENISIYTPTGKKQINLKNTDTGDFLEKLIIGGDSSDNIPSIFSNLKPSSDMVSWFSYKYKVRLTQKLYELLMQTKPQIETLFKNDLIREGIREIKYLDGNSDEAMFYSKILKKQVNLKRLPSMSRGSTTLKKSYENSVESKALIEANPQVKFYYERNSKLMDLTKIPSDKKMDIIKTFKNKKRSEMGLRELVETYGGTLSALR